MVTINKAKTARPKILTESDQILSELSDELASLKDRMEQLEGEQTESRDMLNKMGMYEEFAEQSFDKLIEERGQHKENYQVIANVMQNLKSPVTNVVDNLSGLISEIGDEETRATLTECMNIAGTVLDSFSEVQDFCIDEGSALEVNQDLIDIRSFLKEFLSKMQVDGSTALARPIQLSIDPEVPVEFPLYVETMKSVLENLLKELDQNLEQGEIKIEVKLSGGGESQGIVFQDLQLNINATVNSNLVWGDSWVDAIKENEENLQNGGLDILHSRNLLRGLGGSLTVNQTEGEQVSGFTCCLPLTY